MSREARGDLSITPETKLADLLALHPELEETLIEISPEFRRLKNPVLRATVAKVATLGQVARIGGVSIGDLVNRLRDALGEGVSTEPEEPLSGCPAGVALPGVSALNGLAPAWLDRDRVAVRFDARPMLEEGRHPLPDVVKAAQTLHAEQVLVLITPFEPAPLVDALRGQGFEAWGERVSEREVRTYFRRA